MSMKIGVRIRYSGGSRTRQISIDCRNVTSTAQYRKSLMENQQIWKTSRRRLGRAALEQASMKFVSIGLVGAALRFYVLYWESANLLEILCR